MYVGGPRLAVMLKLVLCQTGIQCFREGGMEVVVAMLIYQGGSSHEYCDKNYKNLITSFRIVATTMCPNLIFLCVRFSFYKILLFENSLEIFFLISQQRVGKLSSYN